MAGFLPPTPQIQVDTNVWAVKYWFDKMQKWAKGTSQVKPVLVTSSYTITPDESFYGYIVDTTSGAIVLTLPPAAGSFGKKFFVKKSVVTNTCTVTPFTGDTIDGASTVVLSAINDWIEIVSDGVNKWWIISRTSSSGGGLVKIATSVAPGGTNQITISSIPATYTDLVVSFFGKSDSTTFGDISIFLQLNGDTATANYTSSYFILGNGTTVSSGTITPTGNGCSILYGPGSSLTPNNLGGGEILLPGYSNTSFGNKVIQSFSSERYNATSSFLLANRAFEWISGANAINQLRFTMATGNFAAGSTFNVFGRG